MVEGAFLHPPLRILVGYLFLDTNVAGAWLGGGEPLSSSLTFCPRNGRPRDGTASRPCHVAGGGGGFLF